MGPTVQNETKLVPTDQLRHSYPILALACDFELPYATVLLVADALPKLAANLGKVHQAFLNPHEVAAMESVREWSREKRDALFNEIEKVRMRHHS